MPLKVVCPSCRQPSPIKPEHLGKKVKCRCGCIFLVEAPEPEIAPLIATKEEEVLEAEAEESPEEDNPLDFLYNTDLTEARKNIYAADSAGYTARTNKMFESLPERLAAALNQLLRPNEKVYIKLKGAFKEALICTDTRVIILKVGFMTGQTFGSNVFQLPYSQIAGVQVNFHLLTGYFEVSAGGMQNRPKSYWSQDADTDAKKALNCVSLVNGEQAARFREACAFILDAIEKQKAGPPQSPQNRQSEGDIIGALERLGELRRKGILTESEFLTKKKELLARM